jgi:hypothetical protein
MATRIISQNSDLAPLLFWDAYENMGQIVDHLMNKAVIKLILNYSINYNKNYLQGGTIELYGNLLHGLNKAIKLYNRSFPSGEVFSLY